MSSYNTAPIPQLLVSLAWSPPLPFFDRRPGVERSEVLSAELPLADTHQTLPCGGGHAPRLPFHRLNKGAQQGRAVPSAPQTILALLRVFSSRKKMQMMSLLLCSFILSLSQLFFFCRKEPQTSDHFLHEYILPKLYY